MTAVPHSRRMTVEEAWLVKLESAAGSAGPRPDTSPGDAGAGGPAAADPMIGESGRRAVTDTAPRPEPLICEQGPSGARRQEPGVGGAGSQFPEPQVPEPQVPESLGAESLGAESLGPQPQPMIGGLGPRAAVGTVQRPETVITGASNAGAWSLPPAAACEAPAAAPTAVVPPLDGAVVPVAPAGAAPADSARTVSATTASAQHPSGAAAATDTSAVIRLSGRPTAPTTATRPRTPITPAPPRPEVRPPARARVEPDPDILGLSRHTRSRLGSRLFNLFFVLVFALILVQMVMALLTP